MNYRKLLLTSFLCLSFSYLSPGTIQANEITTPTSETTTIETTTPQIDAKLNVPYLFGEATAQKAKGITFNWSSYTNSEWNISYELQFSRDESFKSNIESFTATKNTYTIPQNYFGKNGGRYYLRIRMCYKDTTGAFFCSEWSDTKKFTYVAINKPNFPGICKLLQKGSQTMTIDEKKTSYRSDKNNKHKFTSVTAIICRIPSYILSCKN